MMPVLTDQKCTVKCTILSLLPVSKKPQPILILQRQINTVKRLHYSTAVAKAEIENRSESIFKSHPYWHLTTAA